MNGWCIDSHEVNMMKHKLSVAIFSAMGLIALILDAKNGLIAAQDAVTMCLHAVIPAIFPFLFLSALLIQAIGAKEIPVLRPIGKLCRIPNGCEPIFLLGLLGGYPTGAQLVSRAYQTGEISRKAADRLLGFCSNAGPSFLFGMSALMFTDKWLGWALWGIQIASALATAITLPGDWDARRKRHSEVAGVSLQQTIKTSVLTMGIICGWVILFRILICFLQRWVLWLLPMPVQVALCGVLELSNGILSLGCIQHIGLRFVLCAALLAFGGVCVALQTHSVIGKLNIADYFKGKLLQTFYALTFALLAQYFLFGAAERVPIAPGVVAAIVAIGCIAPIAFRIKEIYSRFFRKSVV